MIPMPSGELAAFVFEKWARDGIFSVADVQYLNILYPHLARAGLIAARLGLERAQATTSALQAIGLPAAVMTKSGRVLTANPLLESLSMTFLPVAYGGLAISNSESNRLFQNAVEAARFDYEPAVRSIPVPSQKGIGPMIVHVMPLHRAAHEIFAGADILVAATTINTSNLVPSPTVLTGLFDLSPAEARLAVILASGRSLKSAAATSSITFKTARSYLERVFAKTGTHQQSELVALLKSAQPFPTARQ
jgi:DNA-binding CsgD family transcriptional regulator